MAETLTREERDELIREMVRIDNLLYPPDGSDGPGTRESILLRERFYQVKGEYADRLPRMVLSRCPFTGEPLKRVFDPFGLDGPWWHLLNDIKYDEPRAPEAFQVLLGAVAFHGRVPDEVIEEVRPGPDVPFVVPRLLDLPGMKAVIGRIDLATGDTAYPVAYFSTAEIEPILLHQTWCRKDYWFPTDSGDAGWSIANDVFDFDLAPYLADGRLLWTDPADPDGRVLGPADGECPFLDLDGDRQLQQVVAGEVDLIGLPTGEPINPFD